MYKYDLKNNPELAKERHRQQNREWYQKHKEQKMIYQRIYRQKKRLRDAGCKDEDLILDIAFSRVHYKEIIKSANRLDKMFRNKSFYPLNDQLQDPTTEIVGYWWNALSEQKD